MKSLIQTALLLVLLGSIAQAQINADLVQGLEGITGYTKPWYSGYLKIFGGNQIHYWFFPSQNDQVNDPVLLWLNGGPGCSSMLGSVQENGPFVFLPNSTVFQLNPYSWNNNANVLYFESPPGGFYPPELRLQYLHDCATPQLYDTKQCRNTFNYLAGFLGVDQNTANIYDLIGLCYWQELPKLDEDETDEEHKARNQRALHHGQAQWLHRRQAQSGLQHSKHQSNDIVPGLPPCTDGVGPYVFFNTLSVKQALHVDTSIEWLMCGGNILGWDYTRSKTGSYPLYPNLISKGYRIWIYSGDTDGAVPTLGTLYWINRIKAQMGLDTLTNWRGWYQPPNPGDPNPNNRQNAGQFWQIQGITIVLFKGCGHMVPQYNRIGGLEMINTFLKGGILPAQ